MFVEWNADLYTAKSLERVTQNGLNYRYFEVIETKERFWALVFLVNNLFGQVFYKLFNKFEIRVLPMIHIKIGRYTYQAYKTNVPPMFSDWTNLRVRLDIIEDIRYCLTIQKAFSLKMANANIICTSKSAYPVLVYLANDSVISEIMIKKYFQDVSLNSYLKRTIRIALGLKTSKSTRNNVLIQQFLFRIEERLTKYIKQVDDILLVELVIIMSTLTRVLV